MSAPVEPQLFRAAMAQLAAEDEGAVEGLVYFDRAFHQVPLRAG
ncbi:hypothetical protein [Novosphingobium mangrovi (ex Hu et al. 2023)]|nr:hypothetical protein [Novosphingobium mangrovi (ex Hu et al. 2023)]